MHPFQKQERALEYLQRRADYVAKEAEKVEAVLRNKQVTLKFTC